MTSNEWLTHEQFAPRVGEAFEMTTQDVGVLPLVLVEATTSDVPGGEGPQGQQRSQFSLVFRGPASPIAPQATHRLTHDELGDLELFLVPIGPDRDGMRYEAAFA